MWSGYVTEFAGLPRRRQSSASAGRSVVEVYQARLSRWRAVIIWLWWIGARAQRARLG